MSWFEFQLSTDADIRPSSAMASRAKSRRRRSRLDASLALGSVTDIIIEGGHNVYGDRCGSLTSFAAQGHRARRQRPEGHRCDSSANRIADALASAVVIVLLLYGLSAYCARRCAKGVMPARPGACVPGMTHRIGGWD